MAGSVMAFLNCPIELLKVKLQIQDPKGVIGLSGKLEPPVSIYIYIYTSTYDEHLKLTVLLV